MEHITKVRRRFRWKEKQKACLDCITHKLHLLLSHVQTRDHVSCTYVHVSPTHHAIGVNHLSPHSNLHVFRWVGLQYQHCMASWKKSVLLHVDQNVEKNMSYVRHFGWKLFWLHKSLQKINSNKKLCFRYRYCKIDDECFHDTEKGTKKEPRYKHVVWLCCFQLKIYHYIPLLLHCKCHT